MIFSLTMNLKEMQEKMRKMENDIKIRDLKVKFLHTKALE